MPSDDLLQQFDDHLEVTESWQVSGKHYQKTCEAWLDRMDSRKDRITPILAATYGQTEVTRWRVRWRVFFMACAELFAFDGGRQWYVGHYLLRPRSG